MSWIIANWSLLLLILLLLGIGIYLFLRYDAEYSFVYFAKKGRRLALLKAMIMVGLLLLLFGGADWLFARLMNPGNLNEILSFLVPFLLVGQLWRPLEGWLDRVFYG